jgi:hypothetical protein
MKDLMEQTRGLIGVIARMMGVRVVLILLGSWLMIQIEVKSFKLSIALQDNRLFFL